MDPQLLNAQLREIRQLTVGADGQVGPGTFSGTETENVRRWWQRYLDFAEFRLWPVEKQLKGVGLHLTGEAERWYYRLSREIRADLKTLGNAFIARFGSCGPMWLYDQKLRQLKQLPGQTVEEYAALLNEKCEKAQKTDQEMFSLFMNGLRPKIQAFVAGMTPGDFDRAYQHAKTAEIVGSLPGEDKREEAATQEIVDKVEELKQELKEVKNIAFASDHRGRATRREMKTREHRIRERTLHNNKIFVVEAGVLVIFNLLHRAWSPLMAASYADKALIGMNSTDVQKITE